MIFNLTLPLGPLASGKPIPPTQEEIAHLDTLFPIYHAILVRSNSRSSPQFSYLHQLKLCVVNNLLNSPKGSLRSWAIGQASPSKVKKEKK